MVSKSDFILQNGNQISARVVQDRFPVGENMYLLFNPGIVNLQLKTKEGRNYRPNFVIFVVWSALIVGGREVVT